MSRTPVTGTGIPDGTFTDTVITDETRTMLLSQMIESTIKNRAALMANRLTVPSALNKLLYGDAIKWADRPILWRLKWYVSRAAGRVRDAWLVLTGKAGIE
jgi:hypothetical protein